MRITIHEILSNPCHPWHFLIKTRESTTLHRRVLKVRKGYCFYALRSGGDHPLILISQTAYFFKGKNLANRQD